MPTQAERRAATIQKLVEATIDALSEVGYANTTVKAICARAGLSQGALFRQFDTRLDLVARAVQTIGQRHLAAFSDVFAPGAALDFKRVVQMIHDLCRTPTHAAWHEVMVAARTDSGLKAAVSAVLADFEAAIIGAVQALAPVPPERELRAVTAVLSVMHMFDSEAVTVPIKASADIEQARLDWAAEFLAAELSPA